MKMQIDKQEGYAPYFITVVYEDDNHMQSTVVFSYMQDAEDFCKTVEKNGRKVLKRPTLSSDFSRKIKPEKPMIWDQDEELFNSMLEEILNA